MDRKNPINLAEYIDHTLLKPSATIEDIEKLCQEAIQYKFKAVCVSPSFISQAKEYLIDTNIIVVAVIGFPLGISQTATKAFEAKEAISAGADEIDMVINIGALKEKRYQLVYDDIAAVVSESKPHPVKVIIETCYLSENEKIIACAIASVAKASFVKTSTGFGDKGAVVEDIKLMKAVLPNNVKIKASGGIKTYEEAISMIEAGADRIGLSSSVNIIKKSLEK